MGSQVKGAAAAEGATIRTLRPPPPPPAPTRRTHRRSHGLQWPLHPQQVAAWIVLASFAVLTTAVAAPCLASVEARIAVLTLAAAIYLSHAIVHLTATLLDPADPNLLAKSSSNEAVPTFDRSRHVHVIENGR